MVRGLSTPVALYNRGKPRTPPLLLGCAVVGVGCVVVDVVFIIVVADICSS